MEQVRLCAVCTTENWLGSSRNNIQGWKTVWICYCHDLPSEKGDLLFGRRAPMNQRPGYREKPLGHAPPHFCLGLSLEYHIFIFLSVKFPLVLLKIKTNAKTCCYSMERWGRSLSSNAAPNYSKHRLGRGRVPRFGHNWAFLSRHHPSEITLALQLLSFGK